MPLNRIQPDIADAKMNRIGEIVGNERASFIISKLELSSSAAAVGYLVHVLASSPPGLLLPRSGRGRGSYRIGL